MSEPAARRWRALGTGVAVLATESDGLAAAAAAVAAVLADVDAACSRFRPDSEISRLNARAGEVVAVSPLLGGAIATALRAARLSEGAVDLTVGAAVRRAGYDDDFASLPPDGAPLVHPPAPVPGWRVVDLDETANLVRVPAGVEIDLGSVGKALAADLAAAAAHAVAGGGVLVSLGGDLATAGPPPPGGWRVLATDDSNAALDADGETVCITSGAVATSSTAVRRWKRGGAIVHHLIDPATGYPTTGPWRTVTVAAATCVDANTAATASIVRGRDAARWLEEIGLPALLVDNSGTGVRVGGWPEPGDAPGTAHVRGATR